VLNGAQGVTGALAEIIQQAGALTGMARESLMPAVTGNGAPPTGKETKQASTGQHAKQSSQSDAATDERR
jgi:hypothetical protein